jgi:hypothetical protein
VSDNAERFARETIVVRGYVKSANSYMWVSALALTVLVALRPEALNWAICFSFLLSIVFAAMYQYFGLRFLVNLGTRYDLMPIVKRSRWLRGWSNRPIVYYVSGMLAFACGWLSLIWQAL